ncbi:RluA family pseudouridine synthase [Lacticaseibacillus suibinensis]|uniref:RluA family pseudouridine synthase n=1 Tax=Lacticaseibacillus suibinensis TaxID=2486011 RepID=UPI00194294E8|nr:RluA family pseudouridine synthase [Lacticaseibacillus suibinensis]
MPEFEFHLLASAQPSVRALLTALQLPKKWQAHLRLTEGVLIGGQYRPFNQPVMAGEPVTLRFVAPAPLYQPELGKLAIAYEDASVIVVDKAAGMKPHPNQPDETGTLMNLVAGYLAPKPAYITHRLDMATSGLMLIAKDPLSQAILNQQLATKAMARRYQALVPRGIAVSGDIGLPIGLDPNDKRKRMVRADGLPAFTHFERLEETSTSSRVLLTLRTGRTHQLRVHLAAIGYPILGDPLYAPGSAVKRLMLHATSLTWRQPLTGQPLTATAAAPF